MIPNKALAVAGALGALALGAAGCDQQGRIANGQGATYTASNYCTPFGAGRTTNVGYSAQADPAMAFEDCLHRWGYALAPARDQADVVARAAVGVCSTALAKWNQQAMDQNGQAGQGGQGMDQNGQGMDQNGQGAGQGAISLTDGQPTDLMRDHAQYAQSRALFYVVQARAGHCSGPAPSLMAEAAPPTANPARASAQLPPAPAAGAG